jgi:hypothetical protein
MLVRSRVALSRMSCNVPCTVHPRRDQSEGGKRKENVAEAGGTSLSYVLRCHCKVGIVLFVTQADMQLGMYSGG